MRVMVIYKEINNYFINLGETNEFSDHNIIDTFCYFFQQHGGFPGFLFYKN